MYSVMNLTFASSTSITAYLEEFLSENLKLSIKHATIPGKRLAPVLFVITLNPFSFSMFVIILVVVVFPLVPVTKITLYPLETVFKIFLSNFKATLPGKVLPPFKKFFDINSTTLLEIILINDFILIVLTTLNFIL